MGHRGCLEEEEKCELLYIWREAWKIISYMKLVGGSKGDTFDCQEIDMRVYLEGRCYIMKGKTCVEMETHAKERNGEDKKSRKE